MTYKEATGRTNVACAHQNGCNYSSKVSCLRSQTGLRVHVGQQILKNTKKKQQYLAYNNSIAQYKLDLVTEFPLASDRCSKRIDNFQANVYIPQLLQEN